MSLLRMNVGMAVTMARTAGSRTVSFALAAGSSKQPEKTTQARK